MSFVGQVLCHRQVICSAFCALAMPGTPTAVAAEAAAALRRNCLRVVLTPPVPFASAFMLAPGQEVLLPCSSASPVHVHGTKTLVASHAGEPTMLGARHVFRAVRSPPEGRSVGRVSRPRKAAPPRAGASRRLRR